MNDLEGRKAAVKKAGRQSARNYSRREDSLWAADDVGDNKQPWIFLNQFKVEKTFPQATQHSPEDGRTDGSSRRR